VTDESYYDRKTPQGTISVIPLTFGRARIVISRDGMAYDDGW
jgi:hypothetical protein